ncbi:MAG TPA: zinc-dependent metalloprotease [Actinomycetota bacterium]|nr:zinc-dependent metalloprotease [Actinomycetota bacterium]
MAKLIEPKIAASVARALSGDRSIPPSYLSERLVRDLEVAVPRAESLVAEVSGIPAPPPVRWGVVDRSTWATANIHGMVTMLQPLADRLGRRMDAQPVAARLAQRTAVSVEIGALLGFVSRRVLGQYDLLVTEDDPWRTPLYFVGPNMVEIERRHGFVPEDFALWVAVHEVTHRFQFEGVPWLRERFLELIHTYLGAVELDAKGFTQRLAGAIKRLTSRDVPPEERNPIYLLANEEQRRLIGEIQALMAVVEGHGNHVMDTVGDQVIPTVGRMRAVFDRRREQTNVIQRAIGHAIGLEMKLRQYELGQRFCDEVVSREGSGALTHLWQDPDHLPNLDELRNPGLWIARVAA